MKDLSQNHDGYHTFEELYNHRHALLMFVVNQNPVLFKKSYLHHDGTSCPNYFIITGELITGQISYHVPISLWRSFNCADSKYAPPFDGHTSEDVINRIKDYAINYVEHV